MTTPVRSLNSRGDRTSSGCTPSSRARLVDYSRSISCPGARESTAIASPSHRLDTDRAGYHGLTSVAHGIKRYKFLGKRELRHTRTLDQYAVVSRRDFHRLPDREMGSARHRRRNTYRETVSPLLYRKLCSYRHGDAFYPNVETSFVHVFRTYDEAICPKRVVLFRTSTSKAVGRPGT